MPTIRKLLLLPAVSLVLVSCQGAEVSSPGTGQPVLPFAAVVGPGDGAANLEEFEVCKYGSSANFSYTVDNRSNGPGVDDGGTFSLNDGECLIVARAGGLGADVSVTETSAQTGFVFDRAVVTTVTGVDCKNPTSSSSTQTGTTVTGSMKGSAGDGVCVGTLAEFFNEPEDVLLQGRMTGGGGQIVMGNVRITRGFTIHCDITLSNNLEINWPGNKWHLDKPLTFARCVDDPAISPEPPPAPFDTFYGEGIGRLNGADGSLVKFVFIDAGEPGGKNDQAQIQVFAPDGALVLDVPLMFLDNGNFQAHLDQPHK